MKQYIKKIAFIFLACPAFIWLFIHPKDFVNEWLKIPQYFKSNFSSLISSDKLVKVDEERWNSFGPNREELISKIYYNKGMVIIDDFFSMLTYLSPRLYFQSGDGTNLSPPKVEPMAIPLFFFWVVGLIVLIEKGKTKIMLAAFLIAIFAYLFGQRNLAYLLPILIIYSTISVEGIESIRNKNIRTISYSLVAFYGLFLLIRVFLLK